jgi:enamine deaminase RidA (YjgF/YER057c/UK114 family)
MTPDDAALPITVAGWPPPSGYSDAMRARGTLVTLAGQIGWNPVTHAIESDDFTDQAAQTLRNIVEVLHAAGMEPAHLVRLTWFITSAAEYHAARSRLGEEYRRIIGRHYPPMSVVVVAGLLEPRAKVEIETLAVRPDGG